VRPVAGDREGDEMNIRRCETCRSWRRQVTHEALGRDTLGSCLCYPPQWVQMSSGETGCWCRPEMQESDGCDKWRGRLAARLFGCIALGVACACVYGVVRVVL
jgi:hypothetical protein